MRLQNKTVLVTGGAHGIGKAMVERFAAEGAAVICADLHAAAGLLSATAATVCHVSLDVSDVGSWQALEAELTQSGIQLDCLVNNAGIVAGLPITELDLEAWQRILAVNLTGAMLGCQVAIRNMQRSGGGSIINVASTVAGLGLANDAAYTASKAGLAGLTRSIATHCALERMNIRCNSLSPGPTRTDILEKAIAADPAVAEALERMTPGGRLAAPDEIASLAVFLASDDASYCNGANFLADGGLSSAHPRM